MHLRDLGAYSRFVPVLLTASYCWAAGQALSPGVSIQDNTPAFTRAAATRNLGPVNQSQVIEVSLWLNLHNKAGLDSLYQQQYDKNSSHFRDWVKHDDFVRQYAPTAAEAAQVSTYLSSHGLHVIRTGPDNMYVRAQGTVAAVSNAFHVALNNYAVNGKTVRANASDPVVEGSAASLIRSVSGLDNAEMAHPLVKQALRGASVPAPGMSSDAADAGARFFSNVCFIGTATESIGTPATGLHTVIKGNKYNSAEPGCGYTPPEIQAAYNLHALYRAGYDGTGQSIVIIDWCGSPTITQDANDFSMRFGLPALTSSNFQIINYPGPSTCAAPSPEINLDVEWSHAIAPGAKIVLLVPPTASFQDIDEAEYHAINAGLGNVISGSYGAEELYVGAQELANQSLLNEIAAVFGVSANFSSGDDGDYTYDDPKTPASVIAPADSPYATAIGGVSLALNGNNTIKWHTGWGNNATLLANNGSISSPPELYGFQGGSGGGPSAFFKKPSYQRNLPGSTRQLPDISWLADPYTGAVIEITEPGVYPQEFHVYGGTSLACPMFSALWAIANQEAGVALGQAAPYLYSMPAGTIQDVLALRSGTNVTETIFSANGGSKTYSADQLAAPIRNKSGYYSVIYDPAVSTATSFVLTFDTDSGLVTGPGWDNVTGLGVPSPKAFAESFNPGK